MVKACKGLEMWESRRKKSSISLYIFSCWGIFDFLGAKKGCLEKCRKMTKSCRSGQSTSLMFLLIVLHWKYQQYTLKAFQSNDIFHKSNTGAWGRTKEKLRNTICQGQKFLMWKSDMAVSHTGVIPLLVDDDFQHNLLHYSAENLAWHWYYVLRIQE